MFRGGEETWILLQPIWWSSFYFCTAFHWTVQGDSGGRAIQLSSFFSSSPLVPTGEPSRIGEEPCSLHWRRQKECWGLNTPFSHLWGGSLVSHSFFPRGSIVLEQLLCALGGGLWMCKASLCCCKVGAVVSATWGGDDLLWRVGTAQLYLGIVWPFRAHLLNAASAKVLADSLIGCRLVMLGRHLWI